jgi:MFS family permease
MADSVRGIAAAVRGRSWDLVAAPSTAGGAFAGPRVVSVSLLVMTAAFGLNFAAGVFLAPLSARYGWGVAALSAAAAANTAVTGLLQPAVGRLVDRFGPRAVLSMSLGLLVACYLLLAAVRELWQFLVVYPLLGGAGFAGAATLTNAILVSRWYVRDRTRMLARTTTGINLGQLLLPPLAGWLIAAYGTSTAYLALGFLVLLTAVPAAVLLLRDSPSDVGQIPDGEASAAGSAAAPVASPPRRATNATCAGTALPGLVVASFGLHAVSLYLVVLHLPRYASDLGGGVATGAAALAVAAAASALTMLLTGRLVDRLGRLPLLAALHAVRALALLVGATATTKGQLFAFAVLFGIASFPVIPLTVAVLAAGQDPDRLGRVMGRVWLLHQVSAGVGVLAAGLTRSLTGSYRPALVAAAAFMVAGCLLLRRAHPPPSSPSAPTGGSNPTDRTTHDPSRPPIEERTHEPADQPDS